MGLILKPVLQLLATILWINSIHFFTWRRFWKYQFNVKKISCLEEQNIHACMFVTSALYMTTDIVIISNQYSNINSYLFSSNIFWYRFEFLNSKLYSVSISLFFATTDQFLFDKSIVSMEDMTFCHCFKKKL